MVIQNTVKPLQSSSFLSALQSFLKFAINLYNFTFRSPHMAQKKERQLLTVYPNTYL